MRPVGLSGLVGLAGLLLLIPAISNAIWKPEYAQLPSDLQQWYREQRNPTTKVPCCSEADGARAQEDVRGDRYWIRFEARGVDSGWQEVPFEVILLTPNRNGAPVVWWYFENG